jgi:hypothetical protein
MEALGLAAIAAAFGYFATLVLRRYEVLRSIAVEIDTELRDALDEALRDDLDHLELLNRVHAKLTRAELGAASLPSRARERVQGQIHVAQEVTQQLFSLTEKPRVIPQVHLLAAITAAREVIGPLLLPPPIIYRGAGKPRSYPTPGSFAAIMQRHGSSERALDEAIGRYLEGAREAFQDHYPPTA